MVRLTDEPDGVDALACPRCGGRVVAQGGAAVCVRCGTRYPSADGIPDFRADQSFYAGPGTQDDARSVLRDNVHRSWIPTVRTMVATMEPRGRLYQELIGAICYPWGALLDLGGDARVLEIQCGTGGGTVELARRAAHVFAMDMTVENLEFARRRLAAEGLREKVTLIAGGDTERLPFCAASVDAVVLVGTVERVAEYVRSPGKSPDDVQLALLVEVARVLKCDGSMLLVAANRFYYNYFGRIPDAVTGLRCVSLLPRGIANLYSMAWRGRPYRTRSQSARAYVRMLHGAGFALRDVCDVSPSAEAAKEIRVRVPKTANHLAGRGSSSFADRLRHPFSAGYGFVAAKDCSPGAGPTGGARASSALVRISQETGVAFDAIRTSASGKLMVFGRVRGQDVVAKVPLNGDSEIRAHRNYAFLRLLSKSRPDGSYAPAAVGRGTACGYRYYVESSMDGQALRARLTRGSYDRWLSSIAVFLNWLNPAEDGPGGARKAGRLVAGDGQYVERVTSACARLGSKLSRPELTDHAGGVVKRLLAGFACCSGLVHGDLNGENVLVSGHEVSGVIDWDDARWDEMPVFNAIDFIDHAHRQLNPGASEVGFVSRLADWSRLTAVEREFLSRFYARSKADPAYHGGLVYWRWIQQASDRVDGQLLFDAGKLQSHYVAVLEDFVRRYGARVGDGR